MKPITNTVELAEKIISEAFKDFQRLQKYLKAYNYLTNYEVF